ncbi:MAG: DNA-directed RNA polymerase subunit omega [Acidimicrobiales bacterium]|nr:DNA-directed RNA polymerase subunit omega [Acidimicrobiales bacterium]MDP6298649.1 DNA-directed RNA polymerase subunit omega [Acidimicrobiales bacterium]HJM28871.1 DNA-directed RNA polymerase subunit omega [Acidimicrobiales bacterium]HJM97893.1 DNA-directed RNA polymerase subunit omega [Acidimicrobiales bacterium]
MTSENNSMIYPKIEGLLERSMKQGEEDSDSKFRLVTLAAQRARQINAYRNQLDGGLGGSVPPQVPAEGIAKPLSISFEEIIQDKVVAGEKREPEPIVEMEEFEEEAEETEQ